MLPLCPTNLSELPSGKGLRQVFQEVALNLYKNPKHNPAIKNKTEEEIQALDPKDDFVQAEIDRMLKYPFCLLLIAKVFYDCALLRSDISEIQEKHKPATRTTIRTMKKENRAKRAAEAKAVELKAKSDEEKEKKIARKMEMQNVSSNALKANALMQMADTQQLQCIFEIRKAIDSSPGTLGRNMQPYIDSYMARRQLKMADDITNDSSSCSVDIVTATSKPSTTSSLTVNNGDGDDGNGDDDSDAISEASSTLNARVARERAARRSD